MNNVIIFHSPLTSESPPDELDVLAQAEYFKDGLCDLGYEMEIMPFPYNLQILGDIIRQHKPLFAVNLAETLFADGRLVHVGPAILDQLSIRYTGCSSDSLYITSNKVLAKRLLSHAGILTPSMITYQDLMTFSGYRDSRYFLVKSLWEHASFGMNEDEKLLFDTRDELLQKFKSLKNPHTYYCEEYVHGREFNLSLIASDKGCEVLPPAEIRFYFPESKPKILGYKAKWDEDSFEYKNTVRTFDFEESDKYLLNNLKEIAVKCWHLFELNGYARVDFRVDTNGNIYVLEINANPCISPDSGFVAAALKAGMSRKEIIGRIINDIKKIEITD